MRGMALSLAAFCGALLVGICVAAPPLAVTEYLLTEELTILRTYDRDPESKEDAIAFRRHDTLRLGRLRLEYIGSDEATEAWVCHYTELHHSSGEVIHEIDASERSVKVVFDRETLKKVEENPVGRDWRPGEQQEAWGEYLSLAYTLILRPRWHTGDNLGSLEGVRVEWSATMKDDGPELGSVFTEVFEARGVPCLVRWEQVREHERNLDTSRTRTVAQMLRPYREEIERMQRGPSEG